MLIAATFVGQQGRPIGQVRVYWIGQQPYLIFVPFELHIGLV